MPSRTVNSPVLAVSGEAACLGKLREDLTESADVHFARTAQEALYKVGFGGLFSVVVSDLHLPDMSGTQLLQRVREQLPQCSSILMVHEINVSELISAVNEAEIFRVLPWTTESEAMRQAVESAARRHQEFEEERAQLVQAVRSSLDVMVEAVTLVNPAAMRSLTRVRRLARELCHSLGVEEGWKVEFAALFSHIATLTLPLETIAAMREGHAHELDRLAMASRSNVIAQRLVSRIPRLDGVRNLVRAAGRLARARSESAELTAAVVCVCTDFGRFLAAGLEPDVAILRLQTQKPSIFPAVINGLEDVQRRTTEKTSRLITFDELRPGMTLVDPIRLVEGTVAVPANTAVTEQLIGRISSLALMQRLVEPFRIAGSPL
jgi:CheY-like chemotaxis protein